MYIHVFLLEYEQERERQYQQQNAPRFPPARPPRPLFPPSGGPLGPRPGPMLPGAGARPPGPMQARGPMPGGPMQQGPPGGRPPFVSI